MFLFQDQGFHVNRIHGHKNNASHMSVGLRPNFIIISIISSIQDSTNLQHIYLTIENIYLSFIQMLLTLYLKEPWKSFTKIFQCMGNLTVIVKMYENDIIKE